MNENEIANLYKLTSTSIWDKQNKMKKFKKAFMCFHDDFKSSTSNIKSVFSSIVLDCVGTNVVYVHPLN